MKHLLVLLALALLAGCGDDLKLTSGGVKTTTRCIDGYKFAVAQSDSSVSLFQFMPPVKCGGE